MRRGAARLRALLACRRGAAAVEFAIVSGVLITLLIGIVELGRALYVYNQLSYIADRAAREVLIRPDISDDELDELRADMREQFIAGDADELEIDIASQSADGTDYRVLTIDFPLTLFIPNLDANDLSLNVTRRVPIE